MERKTINHATMETLTHPNRMFPLSEFVDQFDTFPDGGFPSHWCWTANSGHHQQHFIVSQKLKTAAESRLKITLLSLLRHLIIIMSETDY